MSRRRSSGSFEGNTSLVLSENMEYDNLFRDCDELSQYISRGINLVTEVAMDLEEVDEKEKVQKMDESFRSMIDIENKLSAQKDVLERIKIRTNNGRKFDNIVEVYGQECEKAIKDYSQKPEEEKYLKNENYEDFRQKIWEVNHPNEPMPSLNQDDDDDDIVVGHQKDNLTCPITTLLLENPVTSELCKHSFSKAAILSLIRQNGNVVACPIPGCEKQIMEHNLKENKFLERKVALEIKQKKKNNKMDDIEYTNIDD